MSRAFPYGVRLDDAPTAWFVALAILAGIVFVTLFFGRAASRSGRRTVVFVFVSGLAMRLMFFGASPVFEDDWHRYLWDGASVVAGADPYAHAPAAAGSVDPLTGGAAPQAEDPDLAAQQALAKAHPVIHARINYPDLTTIYPPIAQGGFAAAAILSPFSLTAWRAVLIVSDIATFLLLVAALRAYGRPAGLAALYWWNPVILVQVFGAGHMDGLLPPFVLLAILAMRRERPAWAGAALAGAVGVKLWPVLLAPALGWRWIKDPRRFAVFAVVFAVASAVILWPMVRHLLDANAGAAAYAENWRRNAFLFALLEDVLFSWAADPGRLARASAALAAGSIALWSAARSPQDGSGAPSAMLAAAAALYFVSPTGYPWYLTWFAPLMPFAPRVGLGLLAATLPLYWLRFPLGDDTTAFQWVVAPIQFGAPLAVLAVESWARRRRGQTA